MGCERCNRLHHELDNLTSGLGIYPKGFYKDGIYTERTEYQNGWNDGVCEVARGVDEAVERTEEPDTEAEKLFRAMPNYFFYFKGKWSVNLNDTWYYACADVEGIEPEEYDRLARYIIDYGYGGVLYWVYLKRKHMPDIPYTERRLRKIIDIESRGWD